MINLKKYFSEKNLIKKLKEVKSEGKITKKRIKLIIEEILNGKYIFKPLKSYCIPKKYVILKKDSVEFYLHNKTDKEKQTFYKKTKHLRRGTKYCIQERQIFEEPIESKIVAMVLKDIIEEFYNLEWEENLFSYRKGIGINNVIDYTKTKVSKSHLTFTAKLDVKNFFPSIKRKILINILKKKIPLTNDKFYHLIKSYLKSGYEIKVKKKSKKIGSISIKIIKKNISKFFVYQGTVLAPLFSNLLSNQILLEINCLIRQKYWVGERAKANRYVHNLANKRYRGTITEQEYKKIIYKCKPVVFSNDYIRAWILIYSDDVLLLGYMKESLKKSLITEIEYIYNRYGLYLNTEKIIVNNSPKEPIKFLGLEFFESKKYKVTHKQRQKSRIRIRADKQKLIDKLIEKRLLMERGELSPYNKRDTSKHQKNILKKKKSTKPNLRTTWYISEKYKPLHWGALVSQTVEKIINQYNYIIQGLYNYFKCTDEFYRLSQIFSFLRFSCYKTLVSKYKIGTISKLFGKFGDNLEKLTEVKLIKPETKKISLNTVLKTKEKCIKPLSYENILDKIWLQDTKDVLKYCFLCNSEENLESHHIKSIKKIREKYNVNKNKYKIYNWKYLQENPKCYFELLNVAINRRQITLCHQCHTDIHKNTISNKHAEKVAKLLKKDT